MGPPPSPIAPPKRRYDQTPSGLPPNAQRSLAPNGETVAIDEEPSIISMSKPSIIDDFVPPIALQRSGSNEMAQKSRLQHQSQAQITPNLLPHRRMEESLQALRPQMTNQQRHLGPRSGFFAEERAEPRQSNHSSQGMAQQSSLHQSLGRQNENLRTDQTQRASALLPQQRHIAAQQVPGVQQHYQNAPAVSSPPSYHQQESSTQQQLPAHMMHARQLSSTASGPSLQMITKQEPDTIPFRRHDSLNLTLHYGQSPAHSPVYSPVSMRPQVVFGTQNEPKRPNSTSAAPPAEPTRPTPAKRSNLMSILNDEPTEPAPPPKRLSLEQARPQPAQSPPSSIFSNAPTMSQQPQARHRHEEASSLQASTAPRHPLELSSIIGRREALLQQASNQTQDNMPSYSANQVSRDWIIRLDPRPSLGSGEQVSRPQSQNLSQYAVQAPSTQSHQVNPQPSLSQSHHRTLLGQSLQHPGHVPSPPPQTQSQGSMQTLYRTSSSSSHHSRMPSYSHSGQSATQGSQSGTGTPTSLQTQSNQPHSAVQSPAPGVHRSHASISLESRNPLPSFERNPLHQPHHFQTPQQPQQHAQHAQQQQQQQIEQRIHVQHQDFQQQEMLQLQHQQHRASLMNSGGYPAPHRTFTSTPPGGLFPGQGQHPQQQSHHRHFSQEGRAEERR